MLHTEKKLLKNDVLECYVKMMKPLYLKYSMHSNTQLRLEVLSIITNHILFKCKEDLSRKKRKSKSINELKRKIADLECQLVNKQQQSFEKEFLDAP